jgi:AcrR family transcriptional regulator
LPSRSPEVTATPRDRGERAGHHDAEILRRGLATFAELGYQATTVRELAKRLQVSHNYVNERYGSKQAFWRAVIDYAMADVTADLFTSLDGADDAEVLRIVITRFFAVAANSPHVNHIVAEESVHDSDRLDYLAGKYTRTFWEQLSPVVQRLMDSGRMPRVPLYLVFTAINGAALALTHQHMLNRLGPSVPDTAEDKHRAAESLAGLIVEGLLPPSHQNLP